MFASPKLLWTLLIVRCCLFVSNTSTAPQQLMSEEQVAMVYKLFEEQREKKKRKVSTTGFTFEIPLHKFNNKQMAQYLTAQATFQEVDDALTCKK